MNPIRKNWFEHEQRVLVSMARQGASPADIAQTVGRTLQATVSKISSLKTTINKQPDPVAPVYQPRPGLNRAQRLTAKFFGDPPNGRSALDQRAQG
jgi:hypothetical protein